MDAFPIIDKLGGREAVFEVLRRRAPERITSIHAIRMWSPRGQIPGDLTRHLMAEAEALGIVYTSADFTPRVDPPAEDDRPEAPAPVNNPRPAPQGA